MQFWKAARGRLSSVLLYITIYTQYVFHLRSAFYFQILLRDVIFIISVVVVNHAGVGAEGELGTMDPLTQQLWSALVSVKFIVRLCLCVMYAPGMHNVEKIGHSKVRD